MRTTIALGFAAVFAVLSVACDKVSEPLAVPVPAVTQEPKPARVSQTEVTSAEVAAPAKAAAKTEKTEAEEAKQEPGEAE